jgi:plastocyanin
MKTSRILLFASTIAVLLLLAGCASEEAPREQAAAPPSAEPAPVVDPATAATITGTVKFDGAAPRRNRLRMDADAACTKMHSSPVLSQGNRAFPAPKEPVVIDQEGCVYAPHVVGAITGQEVHILNSDATTHNIHPVPNVNREWNKSMPPGADKLVESFAREEIMIPVKCNIHPWMRSYIGVLQHPFFAVTGEEGSFSISGLPPGDYTLAAWHEKFGTVEQQVSVGASESKAAEFSFSAGGAGD